MVRASRGVFENLVQLVYEAPLNSAGFEPFLRALNVATGSRGASFKWVARETQRAHFASEGVDEKMLSAYMSRYAALDPWGQVAVSRGDNVFGEEMVARADVESGEFYFDFGRPNGYTDIHKLVFAPTADNVQVSLALLKHERVRKRSVERNLTRQLMPHIDRALTLFAWARDLEREKSALTSALDDLSTAVFFLDRRHHVRFANRAAERILAAGDGLAIAGRELRAIVPEDERALQAHIAGTQARFGSAQPRSTAFIARKSRHASYRVVAVSLPEREDDIAARGITTLLFVTDPESRGGDSAATIELLLQRIHGLTVAEAKVAMRIARGESTRDVARALGVSWHTVRAHLRSAFAKTGTARQSALARLVGDISPP